MPKWINLTIKTNKIEDNAHTRYKKTQWWVKKHYEFHQRDKQQIAHHHIVQVTNAQSPRGIRRTYILLKETKNFLVKTLIKLILATKVNTEN